ncbi:hypothetical protein [Dickeya lacustris]|uniref:DUF3298 domain-containing protein n=1 Tax=Dickeya lacustris TaxID=2259638 RepID=A0ABY8G9P9_9GAMM|nr:hypothetical protein [Dickeya lacustris]WFN56635.1 hypothetical protein O1Q98_04990 [Dickeya lacustris]
MQKYLAHWLRLAWLLGVVLFATSAIADEEVVYQGKLGHNDIVMALTFSESGIAGRYFYRQYRKDLPLTGEWKKPGEVVLWEGVPESYKQTHVGQPMITLRADGKTQWQGEWRNSKGKQYPIALSALPVTLPVGASAFKPSLFRLSSYEYLRQVHTELEITKKETISGHEIEWFREPGSDIQTFQIVSGYSDEQRQRLNQILQTMLWKNVIDYHKCMMVSQYRGQAMSTLEIQLLSPAIMSITDTASYICDSGHSVGVSPIAWRVSDGQPLALSDILWVGEGEIPEQSQSGDSPYPDEVFSTWLVAQLSHYYPESMRVPVDADNCDYSQPDIWSDRHWALTPKGILFYPMFSTAEQACGIGESWPVIPWEVVKQHPGRLKDIPLP